MTLRVIVTGGRHYHDRELEWRLLGGLDLAQGVSCVIQGGATGADTFARQWAEFYRRQVDTYLADWRKHGLAAGPIRNQQMVQQSRADMVLALPGGKGTRHCVKEARAFGLKVLTAPVDERMKEVSLR